MGPNNLVARMGSELAGSFLLVALGCGAIAVDAQTHDLGSAGVSAVFGLAVAAMVFATGHLSGAHLNPAVSLAFAAAGHFRWREVPAYVAAQLVGAILGAVAVDELFGAVEVARTTTELPFGRAFGVEALLTATLMLVISAVATDARVDGQPAALAIGGTVALGALVGGPLTGASMNPARSLGPALVSGELHGLGLYLMAPVAGAVVAACLYRALERGGAWRAEAGTPACETLAQRR